MNQILITEKLYVTPELKRKKKIYKFDFMISIFIAIVLISLAIYAEYDRNKSEEVSKQIMEDFNTTVEENEEIKQKNNILVVVLGNNKEENNGVNNKENKVEKIQKQKETEPRKEESTAEGYIYTSIATINIPKIDLNYTIIDGKTKSEKETEVLLKKSPCKLEGPEPNEVGNFCIVGHNYRNKKFFSKVPNLENGDIVNITDLTGRTITYKIYDKYIVDPYQVECLDQKTKGKKEITLITCTNDSKNRVIVKAREIK